MATMTDEALIEKYIGTDLWDGPAEARLADYGVQVWALVGALPLSHNDIAELARAYDLPLEAVEAAMAYYRRYRAYIDARVLLNNATFDVLGDATSTSAGEPAMGANEMDDDALIRRHIEPNPHRSSLAEAWLKDSAIPVWALVGSLPAVDHDLDALAEAYGLPLEAVEAAMAYYRRHKAVIDARVAANTAAPSWPYVAVGRDG